MLSFLKNNKIFQISAFLLVAFFFGFLIYNFFFKSISEPPPSGLIGTSTPGAKLPETEPGSGTNIAGTGGDTRLQPEQGSGELPADEIARGGLTQSEALSPAGGMGQKLAGDGLSLLQYNSLDGRFYRLDQNGKLEPLTDKVFHEVKDIYWAPEGEKAILEYPDGANILYNFKDNSQTTLPAHWEDFDFSPSGDEIVMKSLGTDGSNRWLAVASADGSKARALEALGNEEDRVYPSWSPNKQSIAMFTESTGFDEQKVYFVGLNNENYKALTITGRGLKFLWAPDGGRLLYSVYSADSDLKPALWAANAKGEAIGSGRKNLNISTWADKCVFSDSENVYCAVPEKLEEGSGLYPELSDASPDALYQVNIYTGQKKLVARPETETSMRNLIITENGRYLYYSDPEGKTFKMRLK
ncbi:MAG: hypothetical protein WCW25_03560 [Patescibacteria group bacterium]|jgi:hypothetical protein